MSTKTGVLDSPTNEAVYPPPTQTPSFSRSPSVRSSRNDSPSRERSFILPNSSADASTDIPVLPPPDKGYAWTFLIAAFAVEILAFGYAYSIGVFLDYWERSLFPGEENRLTLTLAATLQSGFLYISAVIVTPIYSRYPQHRALMQYCGVGLSSLGILLSAFATRPAHLVGTIGVLYPLGGAAVYIPTSVLVFEWFQSQLGLANGLIYSGTGVGGAVFPIVIQSLLNRFSYQAAVISLAVGYIIFGLVAVFFIKERIPVPRGRQVSSARRRKVSLDFFRESSFWAFAVCITTVSFGSFLPSIFIPSYARNIGLSQTSGTLVVVISNVASIFGQLGQGYLSDKLPLKVVVFGSCFGSALSAFFIFGFSTSFPLLSVFAVFWGIFGLGFTALWTRMIQRVNIKQDPLLPNILFGIYFFLRGLGNILSGPLSSSLLGTGLNARFAYGVSGYGPLIIFIGSVYVVGSFAGVAYR